MVDTRGYPSSMTARIFSMSSAGIGMLAPPNWFEYVLWSRATSSTRS
jgi:hypothetical protein